VIWLGDDAPTMLVDDGGNNTTATQPAVDGPETMPPSANPVGGLPATVTAPAAGTPALTATTAAPAVVSSPGWSRLGTAIVVALLAALLLLAVRRW
jgi:hypothetical protein